MGSATTQALQAATAALAGAQGVDLVVADELLTAARVVGGSSQLSGALADPSAPEAARTKVVDDVFGSSFSPVTVGLLTAMVGERWSSASDLAEGIEELGIRAAADADPQVDIEGELFAFSRTVAANPELELALGGRMGDPSAKSALVETLLRGRASSGTVLVASAIVRQPGDRRVRELLSWAMRIVSDQRGRAVATVYTATPLTRGQASKLTALLSSKYGRDVSLNTVVDSAVVGGLRIQVADDVIDASIAARLAELRQRLAG